MFPIDSALNVAEREAERLLVRQWLEVAASRDPQPNSPEPTQLVHAGEVASRHGVAT